MYTWFLMIHEPSKTQKCVSVSKEIAISEERWTNMNNTLSGKRRAYVASIWIHVVDKN